MTRTAATIMPNLVLVGGSGILETFSLPLSDLEQSQLRQSAEVIRGALDELERPTHSVPIQNQPA